MADRSIHSQSLLKQLKGYGIVSRKSPWPFPLPSFVAGLSLLIFIAFFATGPTQAVAECTANADCWDSFPQVCSLDGQCVDRTIALDGVRVDTGGPVRVGLPFGLMLEVPFFRNNLVPKTMVVHCPKCSLVLPTGVSRIGQVEVFVDVIPGVPVDSFPIVVSDEIGNFAFADRNANFLFDSGDIPGEIRSGSLVVVMTLPDQSNPLQARDGVVRLTVDPVIIATVEGTHPVPLTVVSVDPDNGGATDAQGIPPLIATKTFTLEVLPGIDQFCPCAGPASDGAWKNHGKYVSCVAHTLKEFVANGSISQNETGALVSEAAQSDCGKKK